MIISVIIAVAASIMAIVLAVFLYQRYGRSRLASASSEASRLIEDAKREADNSRKSAEIAAKEHGADVFMAKPFGVNELFNLVQTFVVEPEPAEGLK
jgi:hypothetical protein